MERVTAARRSTTVAFVGAGVAFASWVSRIPQIRVALQLSAADLGLVLLALAVGSLLALPTAAILLRRFSTRTVVSVMALVAAGALTVIGARASPVVGPKRRPPDNPEWSAPTSTVSGPEGARHAGRAGRGDGSLPGLTPDLS